MAVKSQDFVIADLDDVLKKKTAVKPGYDQVKRAFLQLEESVEIRSLSGFKKGKSPSSAMEKQRGRNPSFKTFRRRRSKMR